MLLLATRYQIYHCIAKGGQGSVHKALDYVTDEYRAIKIIRKQYVAGEGVLKSEDYRSAYFARREADLHAEVSGYPGIIGFHEYFSDEHNHYLVLDYSSGVTLEEAMEKKWPCTRTEEGMRKIILQTIDAIVYCHGKGVYHRDIKPGNILVEEDWSVKLLDFGLATNEMKSNLRCGSSRFASPEIVMLHRQRENLYSPSEADKWALGITILFLISGLIPWEKADMMTDQKFYEYQKAGARDPYYLKFMAPGISSQASRVLSSMLSYDDCTRPSLKKLRSEIVKIARFREPPRRPLESRIRHLQMVSEVNGTSDDVVHSSDRTDFGLPRLGIAVRTPTTRIASSQLNIITFDSQMTLRAPPPPLPMPVLPQELLDMELEKIPLPKVERKQRKFWRTLGSWIRRKKSVRVEVELSS